MTVYGDEGKRRMEESVKGRLWRTWKEDCGERGRRMLENVRGNGRESEGGMGGYGIGENHDLRFLMRIWLEFESFCVSLCPNIK